MTFRQVGEANHALVLRNLTHHFGSHQVLASLSLSVLPGEFVSLLGPSGCGKSTLLRAIAGLLQPTTGHIDLHGKTVFDANAAIWLGPERRGLGMVFQDYALWPHMTVEQNVGFALQVRHAPLVSRQERVNAALARVSLSELAHRKPGELSGGQQQRVGLARAIVTDPKVLLFDEPLSNLDASLRESLGREIATVVKSLNAAAIYVTHDRQEALSLSDRIAVMHEGRIEQIATPQELYSRPASVNVASFLQVGSIYEGRWVNQMFVPDAFSLVANTNGAGVCMDHVGSIDVPRDNDRIKLLIPQRAIECGDSVGVGPQIQVQVKHCWYAGEHYDIEGQWLIGQPTLRWRSPVALNVNTVTPVSLRADALHIYSPDSGLLLH
jgi:ABC-type Fe3+/spermidine/putrescine transport system ATPase subunit